MDQQPNLFPLKVIVISLGILLVGGTIALFATIASKADSQAAHAPCAKDPTLKLGLGGKVNIGTITPQGDTIQISMTTDKDIKVMTIDRCSGTVIQTLSIQP